MLSICDSFIGQYQCRKSSLSLSLCLCVAVLFRHYRICAAKMRVDVGYDELDCSYY